MTGGPQLMIRLCPERCSEEHTCIKGTGGGASGSNAQQVDHQPVFLQDAFTQFDEAEVP